MTEIKTTFGSIVRSGRWTVPDTLPVELLCSNAELDFRDAKLEPGVTTLEVKVTMASLEIIVPPGMTVDVQLVPFLGSVEQKHTTLRMLPAGTEARPTESDTARDDPYRTAPYEDDTPSLRIVGNVRFASLEVITCAPGETPDDARRRERDRRRNMRSWTA